MKPLEPLEPRRLLAATLEGEVLRVTGTAVNDRITIYAEGDRLVARVNAAQQTFALADVSALWLDAHRGDDHVELAERLRLPATLRGSGGDDTIYGGALDDRIDGGGGDDVLHGRAGDDVLIGADGNDALNGWDGRDTLVGGLGENLLSGGPGRDVADYGWVAETRRDPANRSSTLRYGLVVMLHEDQRAWASGSLDYIAADVEAIDGTRFRDRMTGNSLDNYFRGRGGPDRLSGGGGDDTLVGDAGADQLWGNDGRDHLFAGDGHDLAWGGDDDDYILGGNGDDQLHGNGGRDSLHGGAGADTLRGNGGIDTLRGGTGGGDHAAGRDVVILDADDDRDRVINVAFRRG